MSRNQAPPPDMTMVPVSNIVQLTGGVIEIVLPVLVLKHLGMGQDMVGYLFGLSGIFGVVAAFASGRIKTAGQERRLIVIPMFVRVAAGRM